jgi:hypothetical protein
VEMADVPRIALRAYELCTRRKGARDSEKIYFSATNRIPAMLEDRLSDTESKQVDRCFRNELVEHILAKELGAWWDRFCLYCRSCTGRRLVDRVRIVPSKIRNAVDA